MFPLREGEGDGADAPSGAKAKGDHKGRPYGWVGVGSVSGFRWFDD